MCNNKSGALVNAPSLNRIKTGCSVILRNLGAALRVVK